MQFFWPTFSVACHLTLVCIRGGVLLLFLMLPWFDWSALQALVFHAICIFEFNCFALFTSRFDADYNLLYLVRFYFRAGSIDHQFFFNRVWNFYMLQWFSSWFLLFLSSGIIPLIRGFYSPSLGFQLSLFVVKFFSLGFFYFSIS